MTPFHVRGKPWVRKVAAVAPMFHLPVAGVAMVLAIDQILDMGRTMTNVIGNSVATAVIAKWEGKHVTATAGSAAFEAVESLEHVEAAAK